MPKVVYIRHDDTRHEVEVPVGTSVMRGAVDNGIRGIDGDCGGECACATCHVYVDAQWLDKVGRVAAGSQEAGMLDLAASLQPNSRLSCQIAMTPALDGLTVKLPEGQH